MTKKEYVESLYDSLEVIKQIVDGVCNTTHMIFYGDTKRRDRGRVANTSTRVSYASYYKDSDDRRSRASVRESRNDVNDEDVAGLSLAADKITVAEAIDISLKSIKMGFEIQKEIVKMEGFDDEN